MKRPNKLKFSRKSLKRQQNVLIHHMNIKNIKSHPVSSNAFHQLCNWLSWSTSIDVHLLSINVYTCPVGKNVHLQAFFLLRIVLLAIISFLYISQYSHIYIWDYQYWMLDLNMIFCIFNIDSMLNTSVWLWFFVLF